MAAYKRVFLSLPMRGYTDDEIVEMKKEMIMLELCLRLMLLEI